jgi:crotonobetainyl-CoA:carnitine CoA-transferase CaiB-like acyl-CoA transferase
VIAAAPDDADRRPLAGVRAVEMGHVAAGPFAGMLLADLGADVVKVEPPGGDMMRNWPPLATDETGESFSHNFASLNRNKRSVAANFKDPDDLRRVKGLIDTADIVVENYRPGVLDRFELGFDQVSVGHRGLVYASISGFGQTGPYRGLGAFDVVTQAMSGMMSVTGTEDGEPVKAGVPIADFATGLYAVLTAVAWLPSVRETGRSIHLDTPMLDCMLAISALQTSEYWGSGKSPEMLGTRHPRNAPYQMFKARDRPLAIAAGNEKLWVSLCEVLELPELPADARFLSQADRVANQVELEGLLNARLADRDADHWVALLRERGIPVSPLNTFADILGDPAVVDSGLVREMPMPVARSVSTTVYPVRDGRHEPRLDLAPPRLGEHNDEVAADWGIEVAAAEEVA